MDVIPILVLAVLGSIAANVLHWRAGSGDRFLYHPQSGLLRLVFTVWTIATLVAGILHLVRVVSRPVFLGVVLGFVIVHELYSIVRRQQKRGNA